MKNAINSALVLGTLSLFTPEASKAQDLVDSSKTKIEKTIEISSKEKQINNIIEKELGKYNLNSEEKLRVKELLEDEEFQKKYYSILVSEDIPNIGIIIGSIISLLLGILFGYKLRNKSLILKLKYLLDLIPSPISKYRNDGYPEIWNKKMEEETGYTHKEVIEYWEQHGEIMTLLYKGENLEKVKRYLQSLSDTGEGYDGVAFTMTTKSGLEKTFLWTTSPFEGGSLRFARVLTDIDEIKKKLAETEEKTYIQSRTDHKFPVLNTKALNEDFIKLATNKNRQEDPKKYTIVMLDLDNFKGVNDKYGHSIGDKVLTEFIDFIQANIRGNDRLYRLGGDEFALIIDTDHTEKIYYKLNELRRDFFENKIDTKDGCINVGSSWGLKTIDITEFYTDDEQDILKKFEKLKHEIDEYMYGVKYYRLIKDELVESGKIQDDWLDKNGIAEAYYHPVLGYDGVKIRNNYGEFYLSLEEIELIEARKKEIDDMRNLK